MQSHLCTTDLTQVCFSCLPCCLERCSKKKWRYGIGFSKPSLNPHELWIRSPILDSRKVKARCGVLGCWGRALYITQAFYMFMRMRILLLERHCSDRKYRYWTPSQWHSPARARKNLRILPLQIGNTMARINNKHIRASRQPIEAKQHTSSL